MFTLFLAILNNYTVTCIISIHNLLHFYQLQINTETIKKQTHKYIAESFDYQICVW
jgi:hypothetical protein